MTTMSARPPRRRASSQRIHSLWLTALIVASLVLVVVGFATSARRDSDSRSRGAASIARASAPGGPWLGVHRLKALPSAIQDPAAAATKGGALLLGGLESSQSSVATIQAHDFSSRRLLQHKLIVGQLLVELQLRDSERDVVLLLRPIDLNVSGQINSRIILVVLITHIRGEIAVFIVNKLPVRQQIGAAEDDLSRQKPAVIGLLNDINLIVGLFHGRAEVSPWLFAPLRAISD